MFIHIESETVFKTEHCKHVTFYFEKTIACKWYTYSDKPELNEADTYKSGGEKYSVGKKETFWH